MTNRKSTKKALLTSFLCLLLCFSMLVGTTFAWFTDSVESGVNQIIAGNLDVEVYNSLTVGENKVDSNTKLFNEITYWEPGVVAYENLTVANLGTLALKYQLSVNFTDATATPDGKTLADVLQVGFVEGGIQSTTREGALSEVEQWLPLESFVQSGKLDSTVQDLTDAKTSDTYGIVIYWQPSEDDNDYNMNNGQNTVLSINLGIKLVATQLTAENDSFGSDYDAGAWAETMTVSTEAELVTALNAAVGKNVLITLENDIVLTGTWAPIGDKDAGEYFMGTLDGNGHTISGLNVAANDYDALISAAKDATIKNLTVEGTVNGVNAAGIVARVEGNTVIENCVSKVTVTGTTKAGGIVSNVTGANAKIINCTNDGAVSCSKAAAGGVGGIVGYVNGNASVDIINCTNNGNVTGTEDQTTGAVVGNAGGASAGLIAGFKNTGVIVGKSFVGDGLGRWIEDENGLVLAGYCATPANWVVADTIGTADELVEAFANLQAGDVFCITADIDMTDKTITPVAGNKGFTMLGNGYTISNLNTTASALFVDHSGSSAYKFVGVVLENCSVNSASNYGALFVGDGDTSDAITITDCHVKNCTVVSEKYAAAFVAYTAGWDVQNNGPVYSDVTIEACSVTGGSITGGGSVGAAIGHAGGNPDTTNTITNLTVDGVVINGEDSEHTGIVVGTAHVGKTIINNASYSNVTGNYNTTTVLYGRFVPGTTGTLTIEYSASNETELAAALNNGGTVVLTADINATAGIVIPEGAILNGNGHTITYSGTDTYHLVKLETGAELKNVTLKNYRVRTEETANGVVTLENVVINMDNDLTGLDISRGTGTAKLTNVKCAGITDATHLNPDTQVQVGYTPYGDVLLGGAWALEATDCQFGSLHGWNTRNGSSVSLNNTTYTVFRMHYWSNRTLYIDGVETAWSESGAIPVAHDVGGCWSVQPAFK